MNASNTWLENLRHVMHHGEPVSPRDQDTIEVLGFSSTLNMAYPIVTVKERVRGNYFGFMFAEAAWILSGDDRVSTIAPYAPQIAKFSDDGKRFFGAYGPRILEQLDNVILKLASDVETRQAVLTTWRPNPPKTKDTPCTVSAQWFLRPRLNGKLRLHCIDTMRSSDLWLGWVFDVFNFSMLSLMIAIILRNKFKIDCDLGTLRLQAGSQHLYRRNLEMAQACVNRVQAVATYRPFNVDQWGSEIELLRYLWERAKEGMPTP